MMKGDYDNNPSDCLDSTQLRQQNLFIFTGCESDISDRTFPAHSAVNGEIAAPRVIVRRTRVFMQIAFNIQHKLTV